MGFGFVWRLARSACRSAATAQCLRPAVCCAARPLRSRTLHHPTPNGVEWPCRFDLYEIPYSQTHTISHYYNGLPPLRVWGFFAHCLRLQTAAPVQTRLCFLLLVPAAPKRVIFKGGGHNNKPSAAARLWAFLRTAFACKRLRRCRLGCVFCYSFRLRRNE